MTPANRDILQYVKNGFKYIMIPAFVTNYFDILYLDYSCILFVMSAAIFKALADTVQHHFSSSIFRNSDANFFDPNISWKKPTILGYRVDFWHLANSAMIVSWLMILPYNPQDASLIDVLLGGYYFNITFSLFYNIILRRK